LKNKILASLIIIIISGLALAYWRWITSPTYSLKALGYAIADHDRDAVEKYIDVESVSDNALDQFIGGSENLLANGLVNLIKPQVSKVLKNNFIKYVETGEFEHAEDVGEAAGEVTGAMMKVTDPQVRFDGVESVRKSGKIAYITLKIKKSNGEELFPILKMRKRDYYWQVISVENFKELTEEKKPSTKEKFKSDGFKR
jgi:hypothetical protein